MSVFNKKQIIQTTERDIYNQIDGLIGLLNVDENDFFYRSRKQWCFIKDIIEEYFEYMDYNKEKE